MDRKFTNDPSRHPAPPKSFFSLFFGGERGGCQFRNTCYIPVAILHGAAQRKLFVGASTSVLFLMSYSLGAIPQNSNISKLTSTWISFSMSTGVIRTLQPKQADIYCSGPGCSKAG